MSDSINCNYARCAVRHFSKKYMTKAFTFPKGTMPLVLRDYNQHFGDNETFHMKYSLASKRFPAICCLFNNKWHPKEMLQKYM